VNRSVWRTPQNPSAVLKIILDFKIHPIIVSDSHGSAQVTGLTKYDAAGQLDGIRPIVLGGKPLKTAVIAGGAENGR
jgi:hypothetical protein